MLNMFDSEKDRFCKSIFLIQSGFFLIPHAYIYWRSWLLLLVLFVTSVTALIVWWSVFLSIYRSGGEQRKFIVWTFVLGGLLFCSSFIVQFGSFLFILSFLCIWYWGNFIAKRAWNIYSPPPLSLLSSPPSRSSPSASISPSMTFSKNTKKRGLP